MKVRKAVRRKRHKVKTHEERAVDEIFVEGEGDVTISLDDIEDKSIDAFEIVDYGLDSRASKELWEKTGEEVAQTINTYLIKVCATLDAIQSAQEHIKDAFGAKYDLLDRNTLDHIEQSIVFKIKTLVLDTLDLNEDQKKLLLVQFTLKSGKASATPIEAFAKFLSDTEKEENPYGIGLTKGLKRDT